MSDWSRGEKFFYWLGFGAILLLVTGAVVAIGEASENLTTGGVLALVGLWSLVVWIVGGKYALFFTGDD